MQLANLPQIELHHSTSTTFSLCKNIFSLWLLLKVWKFLKMSAELSLKNWPFSGSLKILKKNTEKYLKNIGKAAWQNLATCNFTKNEGNLQRFCSTKY